MQSYSPNRLSTQNTIWGFFEDFMANNVENVCVQKIYNKTQVFSRSIGQKKLEKMGKTWKYFCQECDRHFKIRNFNSHYYVNHRQVVIEKWIKCPDCVSHYNVNDYKAAQHQIMVHGFKLDHKVLICRICHQNILQDANLDLFQFDSIDEKGFHCLYSNHVQKHHSKDLKRLFTKCQFCKK